MKRRLSYIMILFSFFMVTGFNIDNAIIPKNEILSGGPPKDGIPAILNPEFISKEKAAYLKIHLGFMQFFISAVKAIYG